jgi:hypothetical protein
MRALLIIAGSYLSLFPLYGQFLLLDHAPKDPAGGSSSVQAGFLGDTFKVGASGEVWVIDKIRVWGKFGANGAAKATLFGGLENSAPVPGAIECDCHNLIPLNRDPKAVRAESAVWQMDFDHLNWSVPGGTAIQFGIGGPRWSASMVNTGAPHQIKLFDAHGKFVKPNGDPSDAGFAVQVWGHLPAIIEIRSDGDMWRVKLVRAGPLAAVGTNEASLRFGPASAKPAAIHHEGNDLVIYFRVADSRIGPADVNACLSGQRQDGVPLEGCDLLKHAP